MDTIIGKQVTHKQYGEGTIVQVDGHQLSLTLVQQKRSSALTCFSAFSKLTTRLVKS